MRVVIADDSQEVVDRVCDLLREVDGVELAGHAAAVRETSRLIDELHPDILILDLQLLDGSGMPVLAAFNKSHPGATVIVLTNNVALPTREKCLQAGAAFFLDKSNEFEFLPEIVQTLVNSHRTANPSGLKSLEPPRPGSVGQIQ